MTAEEMFNNLGYLKVTKDNINDVCDKDDIEDIERGLNNNEIIYLNWEDDVKRFITFGLCSVNLFELWWNRQATDFDVNRSLLKAINKQFEELGW